MCPLVPFVNSDSDLFYSILFCSVLLIILLCTWPHYHIVLILSAAYIRLCLPQGNEQSDLASQSILSYTKDNSVFSSILILPKMFTLPLALTNTHDSRYEPIDYGCNRFDVPEAASPYVAPQPFYS